MILENLTNRKRWLIAMYSVLLFILLAAIDDTDTSAAIAKIIFAALLVAFIYTRYKYKLPSKGFLVIAGIAFIIGIFSEEDFVSEAILCVLGLIYAAVEQKTRLTNS